MRARRPDAPTRATLQHGPAIGVGRMILGRFHFAGAFWYRFHYWAVSFLPLWAQRLCIVAFTTVFFLLLGRIRSAIASNLQPVLGPAGRLTRWRRSYRTMYAFADCVTERYRKLARPGQMRCDVEGESHWKLATADRRGAVLVTAHVGPWEIGAQSGADHEQRTVHIVREGEIDARAQAFIRHLAGRAGEHCVTHFAGDTPGLAFELADALRRGEFVAIQGDRPRAGGRVIDTRLFGQTMPLPVGPAALARTAGVPLLPIFNFREGIRHVRTVIRPPIVVARTADREADIQSAVAALARDIEWAIRERPHQWFCFRNLWG